MAESIEMRLEPGTERFDPADERWLRQVRDLAQELHRTGVRLQPSAPEPDTKGTVDQLVVSLGSAGAFTAMVEVVKSWLGRDRSRTLVMTFYKDGQPKAIKLSGRVADVAVVERMKSLFKD